MQPRGLTVGAAIELTLKRGWRPVINEGKYHQFEHPDADYPITIVGNLDDVLSAGAAESVLKALDHVSIPTAFQRSSRG